MLRHRAAFLGRQAAADRQHRSTGIVAPQPFPPRNKLRFEIGGGLAGKRRIGRPAAFARSAMAGSARFEPARRIAVGIEAGAIGIGGGG